MAASRALASQGPTPLINDPYAEPLVRAVGIDACTRVVSGEIPEVDGDDPVFNRQQMAE